MLFLSKGGNWKKDFKNMDKAMNIKHLSLVVYIGLDQDIGNYYINALFESNILKAFINGEAQESIY